MGDFMTKRDRSGLPSVYRISVLGSNPLTIEVMLSNGFATEYDITKIYDPEGDESWRFAQLIRAVGLVSITDTDELLGRLYHGNLYGWWYLVKPSYYK